MDCMKMGALIRSLRKEKGMTQLELAQAIQVSDKAVSKWERGQGCPDVSLLTALSDILGVNLEQMLTGDLAPNPLDGGNMKRIQFYVCPNCGNVLTAAVDADISCCGRKLTAFVGKNANDEHKLLLETVEDETYITFSHPMEKGHYIRFIAWVGYDRVMLVRLYPEQGGELRIPQLRSGKLYACCSKHGLFVY